MIQLILRIAIDLEMHVFKEIGRSFVQLAVHKVLLQKIRFFTNIVRNQKFSSYVDF